MILPEQHNESLSRLEPPRHGCRDLFLATTAANTAKGLA
jgi:hypothetical protein